VTEPTELVVCYIEGKTYPRATCHIHHKNPQHAGGSDAASNLIWLSANAHQLVHRAAQMIKAGRRSQAADLAMISYPSPAQRQRFMEIVNTEVRSSLEAQEVGAGRAEITVEVPIPREEYAKLKLLVSEYRLGNKKRISISDYVARVVLAHLHKHVP